MNSKDLNVRQQRQISFLIVAVGFIFVHQYLNVREFHWDAKEYWKLGSLEALLDQKNIRGYFYPLLLAPMKLISELMGDRWFYAYRLGTSVVYAFVLACVIPDLFVGIFGGKLSVMRRIFVPTLIALLYPGLLVYPLSDLPAFLLLFCGLAVAVSRHKIPELILAGTLVGAAYNVRTIYLFPLIIVAICVPLVILRGREWKCRCLGGAAYLMGVALIFIPQAIINKHVQNVASPFVMAKAAGRSLIAAQLQWGITMQRYETSIDARVPAPQQVYLDKAGEEIFAAERIQSPMTVRSYLSLVLSRPLDFLGIYGRHLVNGIDLRDGKVYITSPTYNKNYLSITSFTLIWIGLFVLVRMRHSKNAWFALAVLVLPVAVILPGAIETRFFLPLHFLAWSTVAFCVRPDEINCRPSRHGVTLFALYLVVLSMFMGISLSTMASLNYQFPEKYI